MSPISKWLSRFLFNGELPHFCQFCGAQLAPHQNWQIMWVENVAMVTCSPQCALRILQPHAALCFCTRCDAWVQWAPALVSSGAWEIRCPDHHPERFSLNLGDEAPWRCTRDLLVSYRANPTAPSSSMVHEKLARRGDILNNAFWEEVLTWRADHIQFDFGLEGIALETVLGFQFIATARRQTPSR